MSIPRQEKVATIRTTAHFFLIPLEHEILSTPEKHRKGETLTFAVDP